jgi:hypothetical protein
MEDYSACGLTPSGPASLRPTARLRSRSARRTWWRFSSSIWSFSPEKRKTHRSGFSMLAGDGGLFGLRPHPFGASVATLHCSASLTLSASNLVEILFLHLEFFPEKRKNHRSGLFHVGWGWRIIRPAASPLRGQRRYAPLFGFAHAQRVEPGGDSHPPSGAFPRKKKNPPKWAFPCWLGMEDSNLHIRSQSPLSCH